MTPTWFYGWHTVRAFMAAAPMRVIKIAHLDHIPTRDMAALAAPANTPVERWGKAAWARTFSDAATQGVAVLATLPEAHDEAALKRALSNDARGVWLILEGIEDGRNLGAMLRTAEALGVRGVIYGRHHTAPQDAVCAKSSSGALVRMARYQVANIRRTIGHLQAANVWCYALSAAATSAPIYDQMFPAATALVLGSEGAGLRAHTEAACDAAITIPMTGATESLNVSVACAIALAEVVRQQTTICELSYANPPK